MNIHKTLTGCISKLILKQIKVVKKLKPRWGQYWLTRLCQDFSQNTVKLASVEGTFNQLWIKVRFEEELKEICHVKIVLGNSVAD